MIGDPWRDAENAAADKKRADAEAASRKRIEDDERASRDKALHDSRRCLGFPGCDWCKDYDEPDCGPTEADKALMWGGVDR